jgi:hypothetical protein
MLQFGGKDSKRHFTVVMAGKEHGLYVSSTPSSAARKAVTKLCTANKSKKVEFHIREITQGSKKKTYGPYDGYIEKLKEPIELKGRVIQYKPVAKLSGKVSKKMKGGAPGNEGNEGNTYSFNNLGNNPHNPGVEITSYNQTNYGRRKIEKNIRREEARQEDLRRQQQKKNKNNAAAKAAENAKIQRRKNAENQSKSFEETMKYKPIYDELFKKVRKFIQEYVDHKQQKILQIHSGGDGHKEFIILENTNWNNYFVFLIYNKKTEEYIAFKLNIIVIKKVGVKVDIAVLSKSKNIEEIFEKLIYIFENASEEERLIIEYLPIESITQNVQYLSDIIDKLSTKILRNYNTPPPSFQMRAPY